MGTMASTQLSITNLADGSTIYTRANEMLDILL